MGSVLSWTANSVLFAIGCLLAADTANEVIASAVLPSAPEEAAPRSAPPPPRPRNWAEREIILSRNLFHSSTEVQPLTAAELEEQLEKSRLPVTLLGTFAASDPALSRATLMDKEKNETLVVGIGDQIKSVAEVQRIERRRVVLIENGAPRELTIGENETGPPAIQRAQNPRMAARRAAARRAAVPRATIDESLRDPSQLLTQARVLPKFENGQMVGLQVNGIKPGSLFQELGLQEGDVITEFNGIPIDSPDQSARIFSELSSTDQISLSVQGPDGTTRPVSLSVNQ